MASVHTMNYQSVVDSYKTGNKLRKMKRSGIKKSYAIVFKHGLYSSKLVDNQFDVITYDYGSSSGGGTSSKNGLRPSISFKGIFD